MMNKSKKRAELVWRRRCNAVRGEYLQELQRLTVVKNPAKRLFSYKETQELRGRIRSQTYEHTSRFEMHFDDANGREALASTIISDGLVGRFALFTGFSNRCGPMELKALDEFQWHFNFEDEHAGIIILNTLPPSERLILDFYEQGSRRILEVETFGERWGPLGSNLSELISM